ncbi:hypothetical protein [Cohnella cholangitidis]|uniref:hypothetical protein n=1 Tax=Cohnella cholangitidis TaxID=2598458 RepID=UPI0015F9F47F|nr:hypothetical protein [Cohnella cholangitidis]
MTERIKKEPNAPDKLLLSSPGGHKYELTVDDSGNLGVTLQKEVNDDADPNA